LTTFEDLELSAPLLKALVAQGYERPTPVQSRAIPPLLAGRDVLACAQTGTGKTAAFALPVLQHLAPSLPSKQRAPRALVLTPTRELAAQIDESFREYGHHLRARHAVIFGGVNENPQIRTLERGLDILVATPGRLLDLHGRGHVDLGAIEFFVLDEADRMLDMGFIHDVRKVLAALPKRRQNLLFSATMPPPIVKLADSFLRDPARIEVTPPATTVERIDQRVMFVERPDKRALLVSLLRGADVDRALVFTRTKHGANRLATQLEKAGIRASAIHGNKSQNARTRALDGFRSGAVPVLIATDIAARGIDVDGVSHVFNYELPNEPESYVHRIGRTGRAGKSGIAISLCDSSEGDYLRAIERTIGQRIQASHDHDYHSGAAIPKAPGPSSRARPAQSGAPRARAKPAGGEGPPAPARPGRSRRRRRTRNVASRTPG
jgi:ATP-dependent RNA helicase RhlE